MKYQKIIFFVLVILNSIGSVSFTDDLLKYETLKQGIQNLTVPIKFYGQVLDQNSQPVKDANVTIKVTYYDPTQEFFESDKTIELLTDAKGKFEVSDQGRRISIKIERAGYEYPPDVALFYSYTYSSTGQEIFQPDAANPEIFYLRKKVHPAYLTGGGPSKDEVLRGKFDVTKDFETKFYITDGYFDAYGKDGLMPDGTFLGYDKRRFANKDIQVTGSVSGDSYDITFTPLIENSGLILSDELLEEAPETGYTSSARISVLADSKKYIYAKTSGGSFYSRLNVELYTGRGDWLLIVTSWTNPAGSRNLKYDNEYQDYEEAWRERLSRLRYSATELKGESRDKYLTKYKLGDILGIKPDGTFDETLFRQEADALKAKLKAEEPRWWHALE